jgi:hypothetical protein
MTIILVRLSSGRPRSTLRVSASYSGESDEAVAGTYLRIVSVCSLKALLILAFFSAAKPSGLRYAGHEVRE